MKLRIVNCHQHAVHVYRSKKRFITSFFQNDDEDFDQELEMKSTNLNLNRYVYVGNN